MRARAGTRSRTLSCCAALLLWACSAGNHAPTSETAPSSELGGGCGPCGGCCAGASCLAGDTAEACGQGGQPCLVCHNGPCKAGRCAECSCSGRQCGDDGCGTSCGQCSAKQTCDNHGQCVCARQCEGKGCGDDGCGGSCGTCAAYQFCSTAGKCVLDFESTWDITIESARIKATDAADSNWDPGADPDSAPDPYVTGFICDRATHGGETQSKANALAPTWNETPSGLTNIKAADLLNCDNEFRVWDDDGETDQPIGGGAYPRWSVEEVCPGCARWAVDAPNLLELVFRLKLHAAQ